MTPVTPVTPPQPPPQRIPAPVADAGPGGTSASSDPIGTRTPGRGPSMLLVLRVLLLAAAVVLVASPLWLLAVLPALAVLVLTLRAPKRVTR